jgi:hypothetical protein
LPKTKKKIGIYGGFFACPVVSNFSPGIFAKSLLVILNHWGVAKTDALQHLEMHFQFESPFLVGQISMLSNYL